LTECNAKKRGGLFAGEMKAKQRAPTTWGKVSR